MTYLRKKDTLFSDDLGALSQDHLRHMTVDIALQKAMTGPVVFLPHGGKMFDVLQGCWESAAIRSATGVALAESIMTLQMAMRNLEVAIVFIPAQTVLQPDDIERVCKRCGVGKTIFREIGPE